MRGLLTTTLFVLACLTSFAQTYNMGSSATGTLSGICSGVFYDSGGSGGSYGNGQSQTVTFCAPAGQYIYFDFTAFNTESSFDYLYIYNGANTSAPLIGQYTGSSLPNGGNNIYSSQGGCITFRFTSDGSVTSSGWAATIGCTATLPTAAQGTSCGSSNAFCTGTTYNFPNNTNQPSLGGGGIYGCLGSTPNPVWYFLQIANPGNIDITIQQFNGSGSGIDVDFIAWGPFTSLAQGCTSLSTTNDIDCSYSSASTEYLNISNAQAGQFYIVLLTNYSNQAGNITFSQTGGGGSTNCNVLCNMTGLTATPSACAPSTNQYSVSGQIVFQYPPTSGTLTVSSSCGASTTIPAPWTSPINYTLTGLNSNGGPCTVTASFSADATCTLTTPYTAPAACNTCTATASNTGPVCPGGTFNLTSSVAGATYSWSGPNGFTSTSQNPTGVVAPTTPGNYTYTVSINQGGATCTATTTVTVNALPTVNAGADQTICIGQAVTLSGAGATSYTWNNGVTNGVSFSPTATNTYTVTGTNANGCQNTDQVVVTVNPLPVVSAGADQTVCPGTPVTLAGSGATTYTWNNGVTNGVSFTPTGTATYTVTGTDANGCQNTDQVSVTVNALPTVDAGSNQSICPGAQVTLSGSGATSYTWNNGVTNGVPFAPTATNTYTVTGTDANGCQNTDQVTVTVNALPTVNAGTDISVCVGQPVTLTASGTATTYTWDNGVTNGVSFTPAATATYTVTGTDANGCQNTDQVVVTINTLPTVDAGADLAICPGASVTLSGSGATSYTWNNGVSNGVPFAPTATNTYTVTGTDANGCQNTDQVTVTINALPTVDAGANQAVCPGTQVTLSGSGATSYTWDNGVTNGVAFTPTATTTYTVTGTDANGCQNTDQVTVTIQSLPTVNAGADVTICIGQSVTLTASGTAVTYAWDNGVTNGVSFNPAATTTYTLTGTDANGCQNTDQVTVTVNALPAVSAGADQAVCPGQSIALSGSGAVTYTWDNGVTNGVTFTPTVNQIYTVTGTDANGCQNTDQVEITLNGVPTVSAGTDIFVCIGGSVTLSGFGADTYVWDNGVTNGVSFSPTVTTTYTVVGTTVNGCQNTDQVVVTVNPLPTIDAGANQSVCPGTSVSVSGSGGVSYTWDNGATNATPFVINATTTFTVTGTDANGCQNTDQVTITVLPLPNVSAGNDQSICVGQSVTLTATGASTYSWDNGITNGVSFSPTATATYTVTGTDASGCQNTDQVTVTVNALPTVSAGTDVTVCTGFPVTLAGSGAVTYTWDNGVTDGVAFTPTTTGVYTVIGVDANGCQNTDQVTVTVNQFPPIDAGTDQTICTGESVTLTATGGVTYTWDNGVTNGVSFTPTTTVTYTVTGTDAYGCQNTDQVLVTVNALPTVNAGGDQIVCVGEGVTLTATGAATYTWDNGVSNGTAFTPATTTTYTVIGIDANGCEDSDDVVVTVNALPTVNAGLDQTVCAGVAVTLVGSGATSYTWDNGVTDNVPFTPSTTTTYTVTGTDANGCENTDQVTVTVNALPLIGAGTDQAVCPSTPVTLSGQGGVSYTWDNGVVDGVAFTPTATGTYNVTGVDANGCENSDQVTVTVYTLPTVGAGQDQTICINESVVLTGSGATSYAWDNGVTNGVSFSPAATATYTVTGTDANGCENTDQVVITVNALPVVTAGTDQTICIGANVTLSGSGATSYVWDNGIQNNTAFTPTSTLTYTVTGTDANGCENTDQVVVTVNALPLIDAGSNQGVCPGTPVTLSGTGGVSYTWSNGVTNGVAFTPIASAIYSLTGTDANGCQNTDQVAVTVYTLPTVGAGTDQTICANQTVVLSGSGALTYTWDNGVTNGIGFTPQATTTYTVVGTDAYGCQNTDQVEITVNPLPTVDAGQDVSVCPGEAVILQGTGANTYTWTNGVINAVNFYPTATATYTVTGYDVNGCEATDDVTVTVYAAPSVNAGQDVSVCLGESVTLNASGAQSYTWDNGATNGTSVTPNTTTTYTVTGTDLNGCVNTDAFTVTVNPPVTSGVIPSVTSGCSPLQVDFTADNTAATSYEWNFGVGGTSTGGTNTSFTYTGVGCFDVTLTITDVNGCSNTVSYPSMVCLIPTPEASFYASPVELSVANPYSTMVNTSTGAVYYTWDFGDGSPLSTETSPYHEFPSDQITSYEVMLAVANDAGCVDTAYVIVKIKDDVLIYVPNTFTPDGDLYNQEFKPVISEGVDPYAYSLYIFNRWGEVIFESHDYNFGWPGTYGVGGEIVQDGTYTWLIEYKSLNSNLKEKLYGTVNLIR